MGVNEWVPFDRSSFKSAWDFAAQQSLSEQKLIEIRTKKAKISGVFGSIGAEIPC